MKGKVLLPQVVECDSKSIGILFSPEDLYKKEYEISSFTNIDYNTSGTKLVISYEPNGRIEFPKDSVWGFVIHKNNDARVYRTTPQKYLIYGLPSAVPGVEVTQVDQFIIYTLGPKRSFSYFSKDLRSEILMLDTKELKKAFSNNKTFIDAISSEFGPLKSVARIDSKFNSFKVIEVYRACLSGVWKR